MMYTSVTCCTVTSFPSWFTFFGVAKAWVSEWKSEANQASETSSIQSTPEAYMTKLRPKLGLRTVPQLVASHGTTGDTMGYPATLGPGNCFLDRLNLLYGGDNLLLILCQFLVKLQQPKVRSKYMHEMDGNKLRKITQLHRYSCHVQNWSGGPGTRPLNSLLPSNRKWPSCSPHRTPKLEVAAAEPRAHRSMQ